MKTELLQGFKKTSSREKREEGERERESERKRE